MVGRIVFCARQTLTGFAAPYYSEPFDVSGATEIKVLYQPFGVMGTPATIVELETSDTLREGDWEPAATITANTVNVVSAIMKYVRIKIVIDATGGTNAETFQVFGQALASS